MIRIIATTALAATLLGCGSDAATPSTTVDDLALIDPAFEPLDLEQVRAVVAGEVSADRVDEGTEIVADLCTAAESFGGALGLVDALDEASKVRMSEACPSRYEYMLEVAAVGK